MTRKVSMSEIKKQAVAFMKISKLRVKKLTQLNQSLIKRDNPLQPIRIYHELIELEKKWEESYSDLEKAIDK
jgi:hypothetical protein